MPDSYRTGTGVGSKVGSGSSVAAGSGVSAGFLSKKPGSGNVHPERVSKAISIRHRIDFSFFLMYSVLRKHNNNLLYRFFYFRSIALLNSFRCQIFW